MTNLNSILRRSNRYELSDNRMTIYAPGFGLGSVHYWDGSWDNDADEVPYQSREAFENRDGELEVVLPSGEADVLQKDRHTWLPHSIQTRFVGSKNAVWQESKGIDNDVAVDSIRVSGNSLHSHKVKLRHHVAARDMLQVRAVPNGVHLHATAGRYAGIHRFIGFSGDVTKVQLHERDGSFCLEADLQIFPERQRQFALVVASGEQSSDTQRKFRAALKDPDSFLNAAEQRWRKYFEEQVPVFSCDDERWTKLYYFSAYVLRANLYDFKKGAIQHPYSCPSKWRLMPSWFWDPCFHGFSEKWLRDYPAPLSAFRNHIGAQEPGGYLPMTLDHRGDTWQAMGASTHTCQQFVHPMTVWDHYLVHGDKKVLQEMLDPLARHDRFIAEHREIGGLFVPQEGGELADNSSRLVNSTGDRDKIRELGRTIQPIDWNTFQYNAERLIARMAREVGRTDLATEMDARAEDKVRLLKKLWNPATGLYSDRVLPGGELSNQKIPESLHALLGGYASRAQIKSTVAFLTDPEELWTEYPVPTLPLSDPAFTAEDCYSSYWNGRVWPNQNWCYIEALCRAGEQEVARQLLHRTLEMFVATGEAHCMENYNPLSSERYSPPHSIFNQGWGTVGLDLILRRGLGLQINAPSHQWSCTPLGLPGVRTAAVTGLPCGSDSIDVSIDFSDRGTPRIQAHGKPKRGAATAHWLEF